MPIGGGAPLVLIGGPCVIESETHALSLGGAIAEVARRLGVPFVFKASFDKANRTAGLSFRGPGVDAGLAALAAGSATTLAVVIGLARLLDIPQPILVSLAPKSVTSGVAMGIAEALGGDPTLTAILVILTGIIGAILVTPMMNLLRISDMRARGFAAGLAAHGIGTARAFQVSEVAGTFAGIAMGLNAFLTAVLAPLALHLLF